MAYCNLVEDYNVLYDCDHFIPQSKTYPKKIYLFRNPEYKYNHEEKYEAITIQAKCAMIPDDNVKSNQKQVLALTLNAFKF